MDQAPENPLHSLASVPLQPRHILKRGYGFVGRAGTEHVTGNTYETDVTLFTNPKGYGHRSYAPSCAYLEAPDGSSQPFCPDSGAGPSLMLRAILQHFPRTQVHVMPNDRYLEINGVS